MEKWKNLWAAAPHSEAPPIATDVIGSNLEATDLVVGLSIYQRNSCIMVNFLMNIFASIYGKDVWKMCHGFLASNNNPQLLSLLSTHIYVYLFSCPLFLMLHIGYQHLSGEKGIKVV